MCLLSSIRVDFISKINCSVRPTIPLLAPRDRISFQTKNSVISKIVHDIVKN